MKNIYARKKQIGIALLVILIIIQFIRPQKNIGNADSVNDISHFTSVSPEIKTILETSCYDCHSNNTNYPKVFYLQPVGWWLANHISDGKREINFSEFNSYRIKRKIRKFHEIAEQLQDDEMPLNSYLWIHKNAKLNSFQKKLLLDWSNQNYDSLAKIYPDSVPK